jgi:CMD domain protein
MTGSPGADGIVARAAGIAKGSRLAEALRERVDILRRTDASHDAVLLPSEPGGLGHPVRAALALRVARHNEDDGLAAHYSELLKRVESPPEVATLADPAAPPPNDPRLATILWHVDMLTVRPREATRADIDALKAAGISEPDIVRLSQLVAFVNYQVRLVAGLRLLGNRP